MNNSELTGWRCPSCNNILNPRLESCPFCGSNKHIFYTDRTYIEDDNIYDHEWFKHRDPLIEYIKKGFGLPPMDKI